MMCCKYFRNPFVTSTSPKLISSVPVLLFVLSSGEGVFYLAFARRNVKMDEVLAKAETLGFAWDVADEDPQTSENIYRFFFKP